MIALVCRSAARTFDCRIEGSNQLVTASALGNLLKGNDTIVVGDKVNLEEQRPNEFVITKVMPRENEIFRMIVRENKKKVTAANCDLMIIFTSVSRPEYKRGIIDRFLVRAFQWGIRPLVVFNKMDEYIEDNFNVQEEVSRLDSLNIECFEVSAKFPDYKNRYLKNGMIELKKIISHNISIFLGQSGVGKSKIISHLSAGKVDLKTNIVGKAGKGSHTTTWSEIVDCGDFAMIDSPGIRSFSLDDISPDQLIEFFPDISDISCSCKFRNCEHRDQDLGCAFWNDKIVSLDKRDLVLSRLSSFNKIKIEISQTPQWQKKKK
ncbi:MAG: ribosome small subunit-dependent GTPase A [Bdellovibrionales bacterium]|jgi:ribosome biogenesis GTPase / thiamine phosphate phosphatase|nr:ribosome small subunit-dependent GTPase A [Bdellovibrionales bacterium]